MALVFLVALVALVPLADRRVTFGKATFRAKIAFGKVVFRAKVAFRKVIFGGGGDDALELGDEVVQVAASVVGDVALGVKLHAPQRQAAMT